MKYRLHHPNNECITEEYMVGTPDKDAIYDILFSELGWDDVDLINIEEVSANKYIIENYDYEQTVVLEFV